MKTLAPLTVLLAATSGIVTAQQPARTLAVVLAHPDDETPVGPMLARYAREGVQVYLIIATDGAQGGSNTTIPRGPELAKARAEEAACAARALGTQPPVLLGFPDAKLGDFLADPSLLYRLTDRLAAELQRLRPDVLLTWGPDGGGGHPDHRLVSSLVTQVVRAGAPGTPEHLFYMSLSPEMIRGMNPQRGAPPNLNPQEKFFTTRVPITEADLEASARSMACHRTQFPEAALQRIAPLRASLYKGVVAVVPAFPGESTTDLFR
jgi:LmbE family N-acetylglucosaminyl deacetylase